MAGKHRKIQVDFPPWVDSLTDSDACLRSVAEDVYFSKALAENAGAKKNPRCDGLMNAANKSLKILENTKAGSKIRCHEGDRAARKFWEAKVCSRG
jgi:hypothetical protein